MLRTQSHRLGGQTLVLFASTFTCIVIGMALVFDVGNLLIQRRVAQDAADAGVLAGAQALGLGGADSLVSDTITSYVAGTTGPWTTSQVIPSRTYYVDVHNQSVGQIGSTDLSKLGHPPFGIHVEVQRTIPATFANIVGIHTLTASAVASGAAGIGPVDVMLALDTTGSMDVAGFTAVKKAVHDFIEAMGLIYPDPTNVSVRIGMARFQGAVCSDTNPNGNDTKTKCTAQNSIPWDDATILSPLTTDADTLITIACGNVNTSTCTHDYASIATSTLLLPTPLKNDGNVLIGSPTTAHITPVAAPLTYIGVPPGCCPTFAGTMPTQWNEVAGTKLANAFNVMRGTLAGESADANYWAWLDTDRPKARQVLVMMTDGQDNSGDSALTINAAASSLKNNTNGNVIVYTVGYYALGVSSITVKASPYGCPGPAWPPRDSSGTKIAPSPTDILMHDLSSSSPNDCQYYAPLLKSDANLPAAFLRIAGKIQAGRLMS